MSDTWRKIAATLLRMGYGGLLMSHGLPKLLGTAHGAMADPMAASTRLIDSTLGLPAAPLLAWLVMLLESGGGLLLAAGAWVRPVAVLLTVEMVAICVALGPTWAWLDRGIEFPFLMALLSLWFAVEGGGHWGLDQTWKGGIGNRTTP